MCVENCSDFVRCTVEAFSIEQLGTVSVTEHGAGPWDSMKAWECVGCLREWYVQN